MDFQFRLRNAAGLPRKEKGQMTQLEKARHDATEYHHAYHVSSFRRRNETEGSLHDPKMKWSPQLKALMEGVHDENSPLSLLLGREASLLRKIYELHVASWVDDIQLTTHTSEAISFSPCARINFPEPQDRSVNMLPFVLGDKDSLPNDLQDYYDLIMACPLQDSEVGKVLYLTVEEGFVEAGGTQRRGGLHIESPRYSKFLQPASHEQGEWRGVPRRIGWGQGVLKNDQFIGGLYMASTVAKTCRVYHALVQKSAVDTHGGLDHLADMIPEEKGYDMRQNELVWMTDRTPHVVLPQEQREYRQFFRLVTSSLSIWNAVHNTANPKVPLPPHVVVVHTNRFTG